ncbi:hypothetical protein DPMN_080316 [Dreissena polymorpha]|uniref:Uncharacterized protein n=1 Tax=Dreissena polymorpha TaxID=45954 RepID=A0A9D3YTN1_DREPO|nr:hypothetical protein DPMN_080316 [Dreissena polymorpha]
MAEIPFIIDGAARIMKSVSKTTTCSDVIAKLPNLQVPSSGYSCQLKVSRGNFRKRLSCLKVWRAHAASKNVEFVIKRSEIKKQLSRKVGVLADQSV